MRIFLTSDEKPPYAGALALRENFIHSGFQVVSFFMKDPGRISQGPVNQVDLKIVANLEAGDVSHPIYQVTGSLNDGVRLATENGLFGLSDMFVFGVGEKQVLGYDLIETEHFRAIANAVSIGFPAFLVSQGRNEGENDFSWAAELVSELVAFTAVDKLPPSAAVQINVPRLLKWRRPVLTSLDTGTWEIDLPLVAGNDAPSQIVIRKVFERSVDSDVRAVEEGRVSITPISFGSDDISNENELQSWTQRAMQFVDKRIVGLEVSCPCCTDSSEHHKLNYVERT